MTQSDREFLDELARLAAKAIPGPWTKEEMSNSGLGWLVRSQDGTVVSDFLSEETAEFIARSRLAVPRLLWLIAEIEKEKRHGV